MMSHHEFVIGYENSSPGRSVSVLLALRLFLAGRIREKRAWRFFTAATFSNFLSSDSGIA